MDGVLEGGQNEVLCCIVMQITGFLLNRCAASLAFYFNKLHPIPPPFFLTINPFPQLIAVT